jgi:hypothetical protein
MQVTLLQSTKQNTSIQATILDTLELGRGIQLPAATIRRNPSFLEKTEPNYPEFSTQ